MTGVPIARARAAMVVAFVVIAVVTTALHHAQLVSLVAWAPRPFDDDRVPWLIAALLVGLAVVCAAPPERRALAVAITSMATWTLASPPMVLFGVPWVLAFRAVVWSGARPAITVWFPVASLVAVLACADASHFATHVARHPWLWVVAYAFALGWFLRALVVWHEARTGAPRPTVTELLGYFFFAPFALVPPYMLALPRLATVTAGVRALDPAVMRSGLRWLGYGLGLQLAMTLAERWGVDPLPHLEAALRARAWHVALPLLVVVYPGRAVVTSIAGGALLVGLCRLWGIALGPAFDRPLLARGVDEWWRRYNLHFRQLLVDLFWTPVALRLRRRPVAAAFGGSAAVFLVGSVLLHWPKQAALHATPWSFPWSTLAESAVMTVVVGTVLVMVRRRPRRDGPVRRWVQRASTWLVVCAAVVVVGNHLDYRVRMEPWERLAPELARVDSSASARALLPAVQDSVRERPRDPARRAALARLHLLTGEPIAALRELAVGARFLVHPIPLPPTPEDPS